MRNKILILFLAFTTNVSLFAQVEVSWTNLMDISFKDIYLEGEDMYVYFPVFGQKQRDLDSKEVVISGYIIPIDVEQNQYVLSAYPFSACFFCGAAGPESVMAIYFGKGDRRYKTDERVTLIGTLRLNETDVDELVYILEDAHER
jgi:hypothetical protein